jgi:hypothetical protein
MNIILMEGESTIFRGRNPELSKRLLVEQENVVDATVVVGQYQVEILSKKDTGAGKLQGLQSLRYRISHHYCLEKD